MTTKKLSTVSEPLNVKIRKTDFSTGTPSVKKSKSKQGFKIACLLFF
jgi:hypothetical protein